MRRMAIEDATESLATYAAGLGSDTLILTRRKRAVAAVVSLRGVDEESLRLSGHPEFLAIIRKSRDEFAHGRKISLGEMKRLVKG